MPRGPGPVLAVHRILIVTALVGTLAYALWELRHFAVHGDRAALVRAGVAAAVALGMGAYLRGLRRLRARLSADASRRPR